MRGGADGRGAGLGRVEKRSGVLGSVSGGKALQGVGKGFLGGFDTWDRESIERVF